MNGDGQSETTLKEKPGGPPRVNERDYNGESEYEYGSRAGFWRLFRMFNKYGMHFVSFLKNRSFLATRLKLTVSQDIVRRGTGSGASPRSGKKMC